MNRIIEFFFFLPQNETRHSGSIFGAMLERRQSLERRLLILCLVVVTVCLSFWRISIQDQVYITEYSPLTTTNYEVLTTAIQNDSLPSNWSIALEWMPHNDASRLIDIDDFHYIQNHNGCPSDPAVPTPLAVILIHSAPNNIVKRSVIRDTWAASNYDSRVRTYFLVGFVNSTETQTKLEEENLAHNDIIQGSFTDAYHNMTYKHIMAFKWFIYNCPKVRYVVKTDDDVFVNSIYLLEYLETKADQQNLLFCLKTEYIRIKRTYRSKWRVSPREYPGVYYPPYCPGFSIIYSADVVWKLYIEAQRTKYFWIDDVHVTGTLAQKANLTITHMGDYMITGPPIQDIFHGSTEVTKPEFIFADPELNVPQIRALWNVVMKHNNNSTYFN